MNIRPEFSVHMLNDTGKAKAQQIAARFSALLTKLEDDGVTGRELAIVKTKLEEACFFAKRGIAAQPGNQMTTAEGSAVPCNPQGRDVVIGDTEKEPQS